MSVSIISRPQATISGETSVWNAVGNPVVYRLQREDYDWDQINNNGGLMQVQINGIDLSTEFSTGDLVWVKSSNSVYNLAGTVTAVSFSTNTLINLDTSYVSSAPGGFINNLTTRAGYNVSILVYDALGNSLNEAPFVYSADRSGLITVDISSILRTHLSPDNNFVVAGDPIQGDDNIYTSFYIDFLEDWTANDGSLTYQSDSANIHYAIMGARQIPSPYGGNMAEYVTWLDRSPLGHWLTRLDQLVMWVGWPLYAGFIAGVMDDEDPYYSILLSNTLSFPPPHFGSIDLASDDNEVKINDLKALYEGGNFDENDKLLYAAVILYDLPITADDYITEPIPIEVRQPCRNPIMLMGRNSLGGPINWLFDITQEYTFDYGNNIKSKRMTLYTDGLNINQWDALQDFITLGQVYRDNIAQLTSSTIKSHTRVGQQVYAVQPDGSKVGVIVIPTKNTTRTKKYSHDFEIEIEFPEVFAV